jgi:hypothetical protein
MAGTLGAQRSQQVLPCSVWADLSTKQHVNVRETSPLFSVHINMRGKNILRGDHLPYGGGHFGAIGRNFECPQEL